VAIPSKPLKLTFDLDELTLDEQTLFMESDAQFKPSVFKAFLEKYSNWSRREIGGLVRRDVGEVYAKCVEQLAAALVPKAKAEA